MATKSIDLPELLAETMAGMDTRQILEFRKNLAEVLPVAIKQAADQARAAPIDKSKPTPGGGKDNENKNK